MPILQLDLALKDDNGGDISSFIMNGEWQLIGNNNNNNNNNTKAVSTEREKETLLSLLPQKCMLIHSTSFSQNSNPPSTYLQQQQ